MNEPEEIAESFFAISELIRLLTSAHQRNCKWNYDVSEKPKGGYEFRLVIHPQETAINQTPPATHFDPLLRN